MYRLLEVGELPQEGDEQWCNAVKSWGVISENCNDPMTEEEEPIRRKINDADKNTSTNTASVPCSKCGSAIDESWLYCPQCGNEVEW